VGAAVGLLLTAPFFIAFAVLIKRDSEGPVFFRQERLGAGMRPFEALKFRTMAVDTDVEAHRAYIKETMSADAAPRNGRYKLDRADSVTHVGWWLRRTSLDELPQLINVLQGRMSLVGPRPHAVAHNELYRKLIKGYMQRHKVRPGLTGWAQVNGLRGETESVEKMKARIDHDLDYLRNWSLRLDLYIILKTIRLVFKDSAAY
jgi:putative colanic acid biosysnthesis UDP-glucose lipid carrier transferase